MITKERKRRLMKIAENAVQENLSSLELQAELTSDIYTVLEVAFCMNYYRVTIEFMEEVGE